jgi:hypothetical protein
MAKGIIILVIVLIAAILTSAFVVIGIILFANLSPFINGGAMETYRESYSFSYNPESPSAVEDLMVDVDVSNLIIEYSTNPTDPVIKAVIDFQITAPEAESKDYTEWFQPILWQNTSAPITFGLYLKQNMVWTSLSMDNELTVTLRTDVVYGINVDSTTGAIDADIPTGVVVDDFNLEVTTGPIMLYASATFSEGIFVDTTTGSATLILIDCVMGGDILVEVTTGELTFTSENTRYTQNSVLDLDATTAPVHFDILQEVDLGADVTGSIHTTTGNIDGEYEDTNGNVGARFSSSTTTGNIMYIISGGFSESGDILTSNDYPSTYNYDIDLDVTTGNINIEAASS